MTLSALQRKVALLEKGITIKSIADQLGVSLSHVAQVNRGVRRSPSVEIAIARAIGKPTSRVFLQRRAA